jgi:GH35 family endo-1,4-beta-xylanase
LMWPCTTCLQSPWQEIFSVFFVWLWGLTDQNSWMETGCRFIKCPHHRIESVLFG